MKLLHSYLTGILESAYGDSYSRILRYFFPELISVVVLYSLTYFIDAWWIAHLKSTSTYATAGVTNTLVHLITKMGDGFAVGTMVLTGNYNGLKKFKQAGQALNDGFWVSVIVGGVIASILYFGSWWIYYGFNVPEKMINLGAPYLRLRAVGIFLMYVFFAFVGFLRGIKNTRVPMMLYIAGALVFLFFDYSLIFGKYGFAPLGLLGSAWASIAQYVVMLIGAVGYVICSSELKKYSIGLFTQVASYAGMMRLLRLSWPAVLDKSVLAVSYLWLNFLINPMGKYVIASYTVIKDLERMAIMPAAAFAQVITFLVSNAYSVQDWRGIKTNIKKVIFLASLFVFSTLLVFCIWSEFFIRLFDQKGKFAGFAIKVFPIISVLAFFDLLQLILAGALRGAANVHLVMLIRLGVFCLFFAPVSYLISQYPFENDMLKFILIFSSFYIGNALMGIIYIWRFHGNRWTTKSI